MSARPIPALSLKQMHDEIRAQAMRALTDVYDGHWYVLGPQVRAFEKGYAEYIGTRFCVTCASGLDALVLALRVLGIRAGDKVLVPSNTYVATWLAPSALGAIPVPVEPDPGTYNITVDSLQKVDLEGVRAIIPVHLYGQTCVMPEIMAWARGHDIVVVEDNAQAHGAAVSGKRTGSFGHANAHSFYPTKNLGCLGEGGAVTTDDPELADQLRILRNYGQREKYVNEVKGINARFDEIQAAFLNVKLTHLDGWNAERRRLAALYMEGLAGLEGITLPAQWLDERQVFHIFPIGCVQRDALQTHLRAAGIGTLIHYPVPPHLQTAYRDLGYRKGDFPIAESLADRVLSLPLYPGLEDEDVARVCQEIARFMGQA
ncbi:MAG: DegT/DnrJ/EryC1/StrS family aminotransferase [Saprospiraceae bacterium]|nr:DegT/DnrJ/EryC1/StrS family aminotransferase [Saprospiraceae bacterium]